MARCKSQRKIPSLETGSETTAQQEPQEDQQQQFEKEENVLAVNAGRDKVDSETRGEEQEEHLQLQPK